MFLFRRVEPVVLIKTFGVGVLFALLSSFAPAALSQTHCSAAERSIFSCEIGRKVLSLCSSPDLDETKGWLQYRFGTLDKLELVFPEGREHPKKHFRSLRNYSSVEQALIQELGFKKGNTGYTVYREDVKGKKEAGVYVTVNGKDTYLKCKSPKGTEDFVMKVDELDLDALR